VQRRYNRSSGSTASPAGIHPGCVVTITRSAAPAVRGRAAATIHIIRNCKRCGVAGGAADRGACTCRQFTRRSKQA
jgi:hypothetical protein